MPKDDQLETSMVISLVDVGRGLEVKKIKLWSINIAWELTTLWKGLLCCLLDFNIIASKWSRLSYVKYLIQFLFPVE